MRTAFIHELIEQAKIHSNIFLVVGDLGFSVIEPFAEAFPDRFLNAGVAEQNMTGIAAGLASEGYHVFTYSIANFPTLRCLEQIRNDVCYHGLPVSVVAVGAGFAYGNLGYSHHAVQDLGVMRGLPGMTVMSPADPGETKECVQWLTAHPGPSYLRLGKAGEKDLHSVHGIEHSPVEIRVGDGELALVATGAALSVALEAANLIAVSEQSVSVFSMPLVKPVDRSRIERLNRFRRIAVVEEHVVEGGLVELISREVRSPEIIACNALESCAQQVGTQSFLRRSNGLDAVAVAEQLVR